MKIKSFAELKRAFQNKNPFEIVEHYKKPEYAGQIRVPQVVQTNGMYSGIYGEPDSFVSKQNYGKGSWIAYGKASDYQFDGEEIIQSVRGRPIWKIKLLDAEGK